MGSVGHPPPIILLRIRVESSMPLRRRSRPESHRGDVPRREDRRRNRGAFLRDGMGARAQGEWHSRSPPSARDRILRGAHGRAGAVCGWCVAAPGRGGEGLGRARHPAHVPQPERLIYPGIQHACARHAVRRLLRGIHRVVSSGAVRPNRMTVKAVLYSSLEERRVVPCPAPHTGTAVPTRQHSVS